MPDILLVQPPIHDFYLTAKRTMPYGLACIASALMEEGFSVDILDGLATSKSKPIDLPESLSYLKPYYGRQDRSPFALFCRYRHFGYSFEHLARQAQLSGAFLVGISSLFTPYAAQALETASAIRQACPKARIVMGGHHPTALPHPVVDHPDVDYVLRGDGEVSLPQLAKALQNDTPLSRVPGIAYRDKQGRLHVNQPARIETAAQFRLPATGLLNRKHYRRRKGAGAVVVTGRGCPLGCSYCALRRSVTVRRPVEHVIEELVVEVERHGVRFVDFEDENLSLDRRWFEDLLQALIANFGTFDLELRAMNGLYPPTLDRRLIQLMKSAGFKTLNLSLATTAAAQLARFQRADVRSDFEHVLELARQNDLQAVGYIIIGAPHQSAAQSLDDLIYLAGLRVLAGVSVFYPAPGSPDYETCQKLNILPSTFDQMRSSALPLSHTTTRTATATLLRLGRILNFIKSLVDNGQALPEPEPFRSAADVDLDNRKETGRRLVQHFLQDGVIRGIDSFGTIYAHVCDRQLTGRFIAGLQQIDVKGTQ